MTYFLDMILVKKEDNDSKQKNKYWKIFVQQKTINTYLWICWPMWDHIWFRV